MTFRYALLGLGLLAAPAFAQSLDYAPSLAFESRASHSVLVDSLFHDTGDNDYQFTLGFGFPGGSATPADPGSNRASRYVVDISYTVPNSATEPFVLTGIRTRYRTASISGATSTPARVLYEADAPPVVAVFPGTTPPPVMPDSLGAAEALYEGELPYTTATVTSTVDGATIPVPEWVRASFDDGTGAVSEDLVFQPGEAFTIRIQFFNVPFPMQTEAGYTNDLDGTSQSPVSTNPVPDLITFNGQNVADTAGADGIADTWVIRALSDDALFPVAGEGGPVAGTARLEAPFPSPAVGALHVPFRLEEAAVARVALYDALGREVASVSERPYAAGAYLPSLDVSALAPGVYVVSLETEGERLTRTVSVAR